MNQDFKEKMIYIIDDEVEILEVISDIIKKHINVNIRTFSSPQACLEEIKSDSIPSLIIVDIKMPKMNGLEFIDVVNSLRIKKPIIVISGHAEKADAVECLKLGAYHLLDKPVSFEILTHTILQALSLEEISVINQKLTEEKEILIKLFKLFLSTSEERIYEIENLVLEKTQLIQEDKELLRNFILKINECNKIDREIFKTYKDISKLMQRQNTILNKNMSEELSDNKVIHLKKNF